MTTESRARVLRRGGAVVETDEEMLLLYEDTCCESPPKFRTKEQFVKLASLKRTRNMSCSGST